MFRLYQLHTLHAKILRHVLNHSLCQVGRVVQATTLNLALLAHHLDLLSLFSLRLVGKVVQATTANKDVCASQAQVLAMPLLEVAAAQVATVRKDRFALLTSEIVSLYKSRLARFERLIFSASNIPRFN